MGFLEMGLRVCGMRGGLMEGRRGLGIWCFVLGWGVGDDDDYLGHVGEWSGLRGW